MIWNINQPGVHSVTHEEDESSWTFNESVVPKLDKLYAAPNVPPEGNTKQNQGRVENMYLC